MPELISDNAVLFSFALTLLAGLATGVGSCLAFFSNRSDPRFLATSLGFSGGVMIYISLVELLPEAHKALGGIHGATRGGIYATLAFFGGILLAMLIDALVPEYENPHDVKRVEEIVSHPMGEKHSSAKLMRGGLVMALALGIHNFPEGVATFMAALSEPVTGISIAIAVAIHNIPEGITVSVPIYFATGSRRKAFYWSFLSGLAEPVGALAAYFILLPFLSAGLLAIVFAAVAGIMVFISFDELLPLAREYGEHHLSIYGLLAGMLVMAVSLILF